MAKTKLNQEQIEKLASAVILCYQGADLAQEFIDRSDSVTVKENILSQAYFKLSDAIQVLVDLIEEVTE